VTAPLAPATTSRSSAPALAPGVELLGELSGSGYRDAPSLVRRGDGQTLQVTPLLYALLSVVDGRRDEAALAEALGERLDRRVAPEDVQHLLGKLEPMGVLGDPGGDAPEPLTANPLLALRFKVVVSDPRVTRRLTTPFAQLFRTWVVVPVLLLFAATTWWVLAEQGLASAARNALYEPHLLLAVVGLTVLSAGFHEFGHAAACRYGGADPGAMGAGLYLVWPAFYTDVDDSYRLSRWGRLRVDLGGLYFNTVFAVAVMGLWLVVREDALLLGVAAQLVQMVRQLAPFVRADGYHILADLTGVPDLFSHLGPTLKRMLPWRWGRRSEATPLKRWARVVVTSWVLVVAPLLVGLLVLTVLLLPRLVATAWDSLDSQGGSLADDFATGDVVGGLARLLSLLGLVLPAAAAAYLLGRVVRRSLAALNRMTDGRPARRGAAAVAVTLVLALVAWAWWPAGQYEPVRADERGTLPALLDGSSDARVSPDLAVGRSAIALVPRGDAAATSPVLLLVRDSDGGALQVLATSPDGGTARAFPFKVPPAALEGGNQAVALGTEDGGVVYDIALAMVRVTDGGQVLNRNEAFALASCRACTTVAVAFQVVLVVGQSDTVAPINTAVAANKDCFECYTAALATQLVVTLRELPSPEVERQLQEAWAQLDGIEDRGLDAAALFAEVQAVQTELLGVLVESGLVEDVEGLTSTTATATATPSSSAGASASAVPTSGTTAAPTAEPTGAASPTPDGTSATSAPTASPSSAGTEASPAPTASP
jgi:putative peptide zinc metalloprotease protein